jgi:hypothetical protein
MSDSMLHTTVTPFSIVGAQRGVIIVHYPQGIEGTDDSVGYLWFDADDFRGTNNPIMYPGDRTAFSTAEAALDAGLIWSEFAQAYPY